MKSVVFFFLLTFVVNLWGQSMENLSNVDKVKNIFNGLNKNTMHLIDDFYHRNVVFQDPIEKINGSENIKRYYERMYENAEAVSFDFTDIIEQGDTVVAVWNMTLKTAALNGGEPFSVEGNSVIKFTDGKAIYHRDYFDMGDFIYKRVPVLSFIINKINEKMSLKEK